MNSTIQFAVGADGIAILTIDCPGRPVNLITPEMTADLVAAVERIATDAAVRGAIITSAKADFMAGADLKDFATAWNRGVTAVQAAGTSRNFSRLYRRLETCGKPVVAAINGLALGGGFELALACHYRVLADEPKVVVGLPEVKVGLLPGAGGTQRLPRLIGIANALPLMLEGRHVRPAEALKLGIVHELAPRAELLERARRWLAGSPEPSQPWDRKGFRVPGGAGLMNPVIAQTFMGANAMVARETMGNYPAPVAILSCVYEGTQLPIDAGLAVESKYFGTLLAGPVAHNLMCTMFINKGLADGLARRPREVPKSRVTKLGVLGAGMMGAGIANVAAQAGIDVVLLDSTAELAERGRGHTRELLAREVARGRLDQARADAVLARIRPTSDYADLTGCELVVEAVFEDRAIKAAVTAQAEAVLDKDAVFASNTSTLPITGLAKASKRPARFIGVHFFSPVEKMPLVEIIIGKRTDAVTIARACDFVAQLRKTPILVNDSRGFFTSRVFSTFVTEGQALLAEGVAPALIENAARLAGMPVGPLAVADEVSLELAWRVMQQTEADLGARYRRPVSYEVTRRMVLDLHRPGRRQGAGFYEYPAEGPKRLWPGLAEHWPVASVQPTVLEVRERLLYIQALETARCVEEGVLTDPADGDLGSILGIGFPAWTGGTLAFIDTLGIGRFVADCERLARRHGPRFRPSRWLRQRAARGESFHPGARGSQAA
ncbi:MAG: 3-hydroxyacyl-CoA dehydrogenase [Gammaproteobacteria bacterium]|nr:MAG: 3-hydroxyacyl-CoA dehydrogenase [Gammaproteobacteria bacterium]